MICSVRVRLSREQRVEGSNGMFQNGVCKGRATGKVPPLKGGRKEASLCFTGRNRRFLLDQGSTNL